MCSACAAGRTAESAAGTKFSLALLATGCPNAVLDQAIQTVFAEWQRKDNAGQEAAVLQEMYNDCQDVRNSQATAQQRLVCCGVAANCVPTTCMRQSVHVWAGFVSYESYRNTFLNPATFNKC